MRELVAAAGPADQRERILAFLDVHPDALERTCRDGHLTASALVVDTDTTHALLMHHRKLGRWLQTGGHADGDPDLAGVALREAREECGIDGLVLANGGLPVDLDVHEVRPPGERAHLHLDVRFVAVAPATGVPVGNAESIELRWFPLRDLLRHEEPGMRRLAVAARTLSADDRAKRGPRSDLP